jgi:hypothetical protein
MQELNAGDGVGQIANLPRFRHLGNLPHVGDLGGKARLTRDAVRALAQAVAGRRSGAVERSLEIWTELFRKTCGQDWPRPKTRLDLLARRYGVAFDPARPEIVLFALQSWYVLIVKLLAGHVVGARRLGFSPTGSMRDLIESIESGQRFSDLGVTDPWRGEPFGWTGLAWSSELEKALDEAFARIREYDAMAITAHAAAGGDLLQPLYESLFPRAVRHALGEYYTPAWLAEHVLDQVGYFGQPGVRLLDPTCGSGTFLLAALNRIRHAPCAAGSSRHAPCAVRPKPLASQQASGWEPMAGGTRSVPDTIVGYDLHPLAVASARANYLLAVADLLTPDSPFDVPVFCRDAILDQQPEAAPFDFVVGNPPWIAWDNLPGDYREATKPLWRQYGLFSLSGNEARHGGGKKDLSMLVLYAAADRFLAPAGRLSMVITQTLFQSKGAGDGFRRFRLGADGEPLRVLRVDDLVDARPFDAANWTSVVVLQKGEPTVYPVQYVKWSARQAGQTDRRGSPDPAEIEGTVGRPALTPKYSQSEMLAEPIDPARPTTPWVVRKRDAAVDPARFGRADYTAHLGANSGGANAVYWLEVRGRGARGVRIRNLIGKAKNNVEPVEMEIEPDLVYPLVRWIDVDRWSARPSAYMLLSQDPETRRGLDLDRFRRDYPRTLAYLEHFEPLLASRAAYRRYQGRQPFYSMYNVGTYTLSAAKVIWRRMDRKIRAAVVEPIDDPVLGLRPVIPQETCVLIACGGGDEAHYLCALLNSSLVHELVASHSVAGGKGFGTPSILDYVPLKKFDRADARHRELAALSRRMHVDAERRPEDGEAEIDRLAEMVLHCKQPRSSPNQVIPHDKNPGVDHQVAEPGAEERSAALVDPCPGRPADGHADRE